MSDYTLLVPLIALGIVLSSMYNGFRSRRNNKECDIDKFISENGINPNGKTSIIWIYMTNEMYSTEWDEFGSMVKDNGVQPYISLCIKSIIEKCGSDFNVVLINDTALSRIIPDWDADMSSVSEPIKGKLRDIAVTKILYLYGGMFVPPSLLCMKSLIEPYNAATMKNTILIGEVSSKNIMSAYVDFSPSLSFIGCEKENENMLRLTSNMEEIMTGDYTEESIFNGETSQIMTDMYNNGAISVLDAELIGLKDNDGYMVTIDRLLGSSFIPFITGIYGVYIPMNDVETRKMYRWFSLISAREIMKSKTVIGEMFKHN